ncbi:MAG TPA: outer membrane beta-barrel protein [Bacteroidales bacterium]
MNEKGANIDLLFRNGLKDYEVLPPPGVWDNIYPVIKIKSRPIILLRVAAAITVLCTVSFLTYKWSREMSNSTPDSVIAFNIKTSSPIVSNPVDNRQFVPAKEYSQIRNSSDISIETTNSGNAFQEFKPAALSQQILFTRKTKNLSIINSGTTRGPLLTAPGLSGDSMDNVKYADLQYSPENTDVKLQNRWSIAAMASPTYYSSFNSGSDALSKQLSATEQPLVSYSGGVAFSYKISKRFSIQSGLYYSSLGQKVDGINSYSGFTPYGNAKGDHNFEVLTTSGTVQTSNPDVFLSATGSERIVTDYTRDVFDPNKANLQPVNSSIDQNFGYLELPVVVKYKIIDKTIGINVMGGLSYNLLVHNSVYTTVDGTRYPVGDTKGLNSLTLSSSLGMGMEYNISGKLSLNLQPTFRYYLNPISSTTGSFIHPYSFGIFSGLSYTF